MLLATYLVPGGALSYWLYAVGKNISGVAPIGTFGNWILTAGAGVVFIAGLIMFDMLAISLGGKHIASAIKAVSKSLK